MLPLINALVVKGEERRLVHIEFATKTHRFMCDLLLYAPANYVAVWGRIGENEFSLLSDHDSAWRYDGVEKFLSDNVDEIERIHEVRIRTLNDKQLEEIADLRHERYDAHKELSFIMSW